MTNLTRASEQLFTRPPDERFKTLAELSQHCQAMKERCRRYKEPAQEFSTVFDQGELRLRVNGHGAFHLNDWSFSQVCSLAGVAKDTINRLKPATAAQALSETLSQQHDDDLERQILVQDDSLIRAVSGESYKRLWNADLLAVVQEFAVDFTPPQEGFNGATGLYAGEQDMFIFLIDPAGWIEVQAEAFAPGFYCWNSEVGKRTVGISTFWFQKVCANHIVWDAVDVFEFSRKHTGKVHDSLAMIRQAIETLVQRRDDRRDGFARLIGKAMETHYADDIDEAQKLLSKAGFTRQLAARAAELAQRQGSFTLWSVVDALTQLSREARYAGSRAEADQKASSLLTSATI